MNDKRRDKKILLLITVLHGFTHVYMVALIPLYLLIQKDFNLPSASYATALVTIQMMAYFLPSIYIGKLADSFNRINLLGLGLAINSIGFVGLGLARDYFVAIFFVIIAGLGGSFFHPAGIALIARLYPETTGRALGIVGVGASIGFFLGPLYPGWRANASGNWRIPVIELGIAGLLIAILFFYLTRKWLTVTVFHNSGKTQASMENHDSSNKPVFNTSRARFLFVVACLFISLRDFAGGGMTSLTSLFLQNAHGWSLKTTGLAIGLISLVSGISNPLFGHISDKSRYKSAASLIFVSAILIAAFPHLPSQYYLLVLPLYGFFFMATYPIIEAALVQSFQDKVRGRVCGIFLTVCSIIGNLAHWIIGRWFEKLGPGATLSTGYITLYLILGLFAVLSLIGIYFLRKLKQLKDEEVESIKIKNSSCKAECI